MRTIILASALAASVFATSSASAVTIGSVTGTGQLIFATATAGQLQADFRLLPGQSVTLGLVVEAGDAGGIAFNSIVDLPSPFGTNGLGITLGGGAFFSLVGSLEPAFSSATISGTASDVAVGFLPREFFGATIGDVGSAGTDWIIIAGPGDTSIGNFALTISAVPAPAALALFGLGLTGLVAARRRA